MSTIGGLLAFTLLSPALAMPGVHCPEPVVAKGEVKGGPPLVHVFELRHAGTAGIATITGIETGCGCLRQNLSSTVLQPGESARLTIEVNTLTQPDGPNHWSIRVRTRLDVPGAAPEGGELELHITAKVVRELSLTPPQLALSTTGEVTRTLTLSDRRAKPLNLIRAESSSPHLRAAIGTRQNADTTITLTLTADAPAGRRDETVVLYTDDPAYPEFRVPVRVEKRSVGSVMAVPEEVLLRFAAGEMAVSSLVQVRSPEGKSVRIETVESDHPAVTAKWSMASGPLATLRVTVTGPGNGRTDLRVKLAEPAGQLLIVPVSWTANR